MRVQQRDLEILRTLARLQLVSGVDLVNAFFSTPKVGFRRLQKLEQLELIARHSKGTTNDSPVWWRLSKRGVAAVLREFPREPLQDGFDERVAGLSLGDDYERGVFARLYLSLVCAGREALSTAEKTAGWRDLRVWTAAVSRRASAFEWYPPGALSFDGSDPAGRRVTLTPTVTAVTRGARVFLELDQAHRQAGRVDELVRRYGSFIKHAYQQRFPDDRQVALVFLVGSELRAQKVQEIVSKILIDRPPKMKLLVHAPGRDEDQAQAWLAKALLGEERHAAAPQVAPPAAAVERAAASDDICVGCALTSAFVVATEGLLRGRQYQQFKAALRAAGFDEPAVTDWKRALADLFEHHRRGSNEAGQAA